MVNHLSEAQVEEAMKTCAEEPIHVPGNIQPMGAMVAFDLATGRIGHVSANSKDFVGLSPDEILGSDARSSFGATVWHGLSNAMGRFGTAEIRSHVGRFDLGGQTLDLTAFPSGSQVVVEFEPTGEAGRNDTDPFADLDFFVREIRSSPDIGTLLERMTRMMRHVSGYDRVMVYKFDKHFNGEVVAESKRPAVDSFLGLHFPHTDIPAQARAMMERVPLRLIHNTSHDPVTILSLDPVAPPLDISLGQLRGVSPLCCQFLRNMHVGSTMTLSVLVQERLWGTVAFHHSKPRTPPPRMRRLLTAVLPHFEDKIGLLGAGEARRLVGRVDEIEAKLQSEIDKNLNIRTVLPDLAATLCDVIHAQGVALLSGAQMTHHGLVPGLAVLERLLEDAAAEPTRILAIENLSRAYPDLKGELGGCAGALVGAFGARRAICIFREERPRAMTWAGNPEKDIERFSGTYRMVPRASFVTFLEELKGVSAPWTDQDLMLARRLRSLVNSAERRSLMNTLNRQQALMIDELNHRVRNILALVRSVSTQARRRYGTLNSYSRSVEARIEALAAAHEIGSSSPATSTSISGLITKEVAPYENPKGERVEIIGQDDHVVAEQAPIVALVIHELATNAAKYGALSVADGRVTVNLERNVEGLTITWNEIGGPAVQPPMERGFGSMLIEQAMPHEMGGRSALTFAPEGVRAALFLPAQVLSAAAPFTSVEAREDDIPARAGDPTPVSDLQHRGLVLVLEDNFLIATEMQDQLADFGFSNIELASNVHDALEIIDRERPSLAFLDVNLGGGETSALVAQRLLSEQVPFAFATGYGDRVALPDDFARVPRLTKPVSGSILRAAVNDLLIQRNGPAS